MKMDLGRKLYNTLKTAAYTNQGIMYPNGVYWDMASKQFDRLKVMGFVEEFYPHNPAHKTRAVITTIGKEYLEMNKKKFKSK